MSQHCSFNRTVVLVFPLEQPLKGVSPALCPSGYGHGQFSNSSPSSMPKQPHEVCLRSGLVGTPLGN